MFLPTYGEVMKASLFPISDKVFCGAFAVMADALSQTAFAPVRRQTFGAAVVAQPKASRVGLWERLDRWAWKQVQKEREAYLARSQNLAELEERIRRLDSVRGRYF